MAPLKTAAALGRTSGNIKAGSGGQTPFLHDAVDGQDGLEKGKHPEGRLHGHLSGLRFPMRAREVGGYIFFPLFCPQVERSQPEPSAFQLKLVQE